MFRPNVKLVLEPGAGARIVDDLNQRTLTLTPTEGRLLALMVPGSTAETLAAAAKGAGIDLEAKQIEALLSRLHANELIDYTPSPVAKVSQPLLLPDDKVPAFRTDLGVEAAPKPGLMLVTDKQRDRSFTLYDFEVHIARLLDGRHTVSQVIESAGKIGIPMTPESLSKFIGQMKAYGFVVEGLVVAPTQSDPTWPARAEWSSEIRELYQSALRQFRQGRPGHALEYLDALLEIQPNTPEAVSLKQRVEAHLDKGPVTELSFEDLHGMEEPMPSLVAASEPLMSSGEHKKLDVPVTPAPAPAKPKGPIWSPPAKTAETPAVGLGEAPVRKTGETPAFTLGESSVRKTGESPAIKGPIWSPPAKTGEVPAAKPSAPKSLLEPEPLEIKVAPLPRKTGSHAALSPSSAATLSALPAVEDQPPKTRAPIFPPKTGEVPAAAPSPSRAIFPPKTGEVPALKTSEVPAVTAPEPRPPRSSPSQSQPTTVVPAFAPEQPPRDPAPFAKTVITRPSAPIVLPAAESGGPGEKPAPPILSNLEPGAVAKTVISRPSRPIFPPKTGEVPKPADAEKAAPPVLTSTPELPAEETVASAPAVTAPEPKPAPRRSSPRASAPTVEARAVSDSPLDAPPTEVMTSDTSRAEPMPERTVVGPPPTRPEKPAAEPESPEPAPAEAEPAPAPPPRASAPRRTTGSRTPKAQQEEAPPKRLPFIIGGAVVLLVGLLFPIPAVQRLDVQLVTTPKALPKMPAAGVFAELKVQSGARVDEGTVIATLDTGKLKAEKDELQKTAERLDAAAAKALSKTNPATLQKAKQAVVKAQADLRKAKAGLPKARDRAKAEVDIARKEAALEKAERLAVAFDFAEKAKVLKREATATKEKLAKLQAQIDRAFVAAPAAGVFELEALPPAGAQFDEGTPFGRIVGEALVVKGAPDDAKDAVLIYGDKRVALFAVDKSAAGLTVPFEGGVKPGAAVLEVAKGYRPWPMVVLSR